MLRLVAERSRDDAVKHPFERPGVYAFLLRGMTGELVKIGSTSDFAKRLQHYRSPATRNRIPAGVKQEIGFIVDVFAIAFVACEEAGWLEIETALRRALSPYRLNGRDDRFVDWFRCGELELLAVWPIVAALAVKNAGLEGDQTPEAG